MAINMTDERLKIWLGFWKWLISSVVITGGIAWATTIINAKHKDTELAIKVNQEEKEYLTSFLERALDDNLEKRRRFAQYFANVTTSEGYKQGWRNYLEAIEAEVDVLKSEKAQLIEGLSKKSGEDLIKAQERISELESELIRSAIRKTQKLQSHPLNSIDVLTSYPLDCPENTTPAIWNDSVSNPRLEGFPNRAFYVTYGCRNSKNTPEGPFVSWYSNGQIIQEGEVPGRITLYYPNGAKATVGKVSIQGYKIEKMWGLEGDIIE